MHLGVSEREPACEVNRACRQPASSRGRQCRIGHVDVRAVAAIQRLVHSASEVVSLDPFDEHRNADHDADHHDGKPYAFRCLRVG